MSGPPPTTRNALGADRWRRPVNIRSAKAETPSSGPGTRWDRRSHRPPEPTCRVRRSDVRCGLDQSRRRPRTAVPP